MGGIDTPHISLSKFMTRKLFPFILLLLHAVLGFAQDKNADTYFELFRPLYKGELAYETVDFVEKYWRVPGNKGFNKTVYRIAEKLKAAGYVLEKDASESDRMTYRIEKRGMENPTWEPVDASLTIVGQDSMLLKHSTNRNMIYLNSVSTPTEGVVAELVYIKNYEEIKNRNLKGKIVFCELSARKIFEEAFLKKGVLGILTYNNPKYLQPEKNNTSIQFRSLPFHKETKAWGIALSFIAKEALEKALTNGKVNVHVKIETKMYPSEELTIIAEIKGSKIPQERLVFSAHIQEPGANDNATGVGAQLEMAVLTGEMIKKKQIEVARTLTYLWGDEIVSTHRYIKEDKKRAKNIKWGISLDMVGENTAITGGSFLIEKMPDPSAIWTRGKDKHSEWGGDAMKLKNMKPHYLNDFILKNFQKQGEFAHWEVNTNPFEGGSDHTPFLKADIPGLLLWHFTDQFYHTDNDRIDKVSKETLKNVGTSSLVCALILLNADADTALSLLSTIKKAAQKRLDEEFLLSLKSIKSGTTINDELKIIKAWKDWYLKTMRTLKDLDYDSSQKLSIEIKAAQKDIRKLVKGKIKKLKNANQ